MSTSPMPDEMSIGAFLAWNDGIETQYELVDGQVMPLPVLPDEDSLTHHRRRLRSFRTLTDLQELWVVDTTHRSIEIWSAVKYSLDDPSWSARLFKNQSLSTIAAYMAVDDVYRSTGL